MTDRILESLFPDEEAWRLFLANVTGHLDLPVMPVPYAP